jgi:hypothetical protein
LDELEHEAGPHLGRQGERIKVDVIDISRAIHGEPVQIAAELTTAA